MKALLKKGIIFTAAFFSLAGCYGNLNIEQDNVFKCETKDDCISGYTCKANLCVAESGDVGQNNCRDNDGDGWGVGTTTEIVNCPKCIEHKKNSTTPCPIDCNDNDPNVHPMAINFCFPNEDGTGFKNYSCQDVAASERMKCTGPTDCKLTDEMVKKIKEKNPGITNIRKAGSCPLFGLNANVCAFQADCSGATKNLVCDETQDFILKCP